MDGFLQVWCSNSRLAKELLKTALYIGFLVSKVLQVCIGQRWVQIEEAIVNILLLVTGYIVYFCEKIAR